MRKVLDSFAGVVLLGVASAALVATAGSHRWVDFTVKPSEISLVGSDIGEVPLATALGFVLLASWGVLLVTRGQVRRVFAAIGLVATLGLAVCVVVGLVSLPGDVKDRFPSGYSVTTSYSGWLWTALVAVLVSLVATAAAVRRAPSWPAMGRRYDAPGAQAEQVDVASLDPDADNREMWKALDQGQDPTDPQGDRPSA